MSELPPEPAALAEVNLGPMKPVRSNTEALAASIISELENGERANEVARGSAILADIIRRFPKAKDIQIRTDGHIRVQLGSGNEIITSYVAEGGQPVSIGRLKPPQAAGILLALYRSRAGARMTEGPSQVADENQFLIRLGMEKKADFSAQGDNFMSDTLKVGNLRVHAFWETNGIALTARLLHDRIPALEDLGFKGEHIDALKAAARRSSGIILVTGKTGQGKSTTLAALAQWMLSSINHAHVLTIEDPIEYHLKDASDQQVYASIRTQKEVGIEVDNFAQGVKFALRESPTAIIIGEIRDRETLDAAMKVAESGHLILSTLHTDSGPGTIQRIISLYPEQERTAVLTLLSEQLILVLSQGLLRSANPDRDKILCYELMQNTEMTSKTAICQFSKNGPSALESWMNRLENNVKWDVMLKEIFDQGLITKETYESVLHNTTAKRD